MNIHKSLKNSITKFVRIIADRECAQKAGGIATLDGNAYPLCENMQSSSQGYQRYQVQGYPYVKPVVIDVPTIDAETASRWNNLPRRPVGQTQYGPSSSRDPPRDEFENNVVYIDLPEAGSQVSQSIDTPGSDETSLNQSSNQSRQAYQVQGYPYVRPVVIDVPTIDAETASRWNNLPRRPIGQGAGRGQGPSTSASSSQYNTQQSSSSSRLPQKDDIDDETPVVYIDLPETGSQVSQSIDTPGSGEPEFIQDTILYDPFENRRIDIPKDDTRSLSSTASSTSGAGGAGGGGGRYTPQRPTRPNYLNLQSQGSSATQSPASASRTPGSIPGAVPPIMSKESLVYGGQGPDGFPISPIPISEFPEPPPAYTEMATPRSPTNSVQEPPRTQVILPGDSPAQYSPTSLPNMDRKNLTCPHCDVRVQTLVIREVGYFTHFIALLSFVLCMPFVLVVYFSDWFKHYNHYCPNCNRFIGYELPIVGRGDIVLTT
ncbi:unnamed protein product [Chrysodeixis includens]|uniref:LITAF domain-containing protein n=1 Tax=Chrysodeixis includens TaxID=689277 RepID=A0A9N8Q0F3_CHRIL|nr:unnamed protein product [Chrysodeixis includens]